MWQHTDEMPLALGFPALEQKGLLVAASLGVLVASEGAWDGKCCAGGLRAQLHVPSVVRAAAHCLSSAVAQLALLRHGD